MVGPNPRYIDDGDYVGGFSRADIAGLLDALDGNHLGWSAQMAPVIMGNHPENPELAEELTNSFCRTDPDIARQFARVTFLSDNRADLADVAVPTLVLQCSQDVIAPDVRRPVRARGDPGQHLHAARGRRARAAPERAGGDDRGDPGLPDRMTAMTGAPGDDPRAQLGRLLEEDPADLYENAPMGYLSALPDGRIVKVNRTFCAWTGRSPEDLLGARFQDLLTIGGRVFHETHVVPLLRMQGAVREIALDVVRTDGSVLPCLINAVELRDDDGTPVLMRATLFEATARRRYERELLNAQRAAEESEAPLPDGAAGRLRHGRRHVGGRRRGGDRRARPGGAGRARRRPGAGRGGLPGAPRTFPRLHTEHAVGLPDDLLHELQVAAIGQLALELAQGVRTVVLDDRLRQGRPAVAAAMAAAGLSSLVLVPVTRRQPAARRARARARRARRRRPAQPGRAGDRARRPAPADVELLWTLGRQAGQALERARLLEETARQAERAAFLLDAARLLAEAADVTETVERLAVLAVERLADLCVIDLTTEHGPVRAAVRHRDPDRQYLADALRELHLPGRRRAAPERAGAARGRHPVGALGGRRLPAGDGLRRAPPGDRAGAGPDEHGGGPARRRGSPARVW